MKKFLFILILLASPFIFYSFHSGPDTAVRVDPGDNDSTVIAKIYGEALTDGQAYKNLNGLCEAAPCRPSGSPGAQKAVEYMEKLMKSYHFDKVWLMPCMVPHWVRGDAEQGAIVSAKTGKKIPVHVCALGGSEATASDGLTGEIVEVHNFDELKALGEKGIKGKIVFYDHKWPQQMYNTFDAYGQAVAYRWQGPPAAEQLGAIAVIVRSVTSSHDSIPHTGVMRDDSLRAKIPSAAISTIEADMLDSMIRKDGSAKFYLDMDCHWMPDVKSYNVIGEIYGSEHPDQVIAVGGHLDAWGLGKGANDDGSGCVQGIEALRIFQALGIRPKHTIRAVCWMNEENGGRGAEAYADSAAKKNEKHIAAIESDEGSFSPRGFELTVSPEQKKKIQSWAPLFFPYGVYDFTHGGGGADVGPLSKNGAAVLGLEPDSQRYFIYHHTKIDVIDNVDVRTLHLGAATMASMIYLIDKYGL